MKSKRLVLQLVAILAAAGGLVYFKSVREREAEENVRLVETRLEEIRAAACACADQPCRTAVRERLKQAGAEFGDLRVPGDREAAVRVSINSKFDAAARCLRAPLTRPAPAAKPTPRAR